MGIILTLDKPLTAPLANTPVLRKMGEVIVSDSFGRTDPATAAALYGSTTDNFKGGTPQQWTGTNGGSNNGTFARTVNDKLEFSPNAVTSLCLDAGQFNVDASFKVESVGVGMGQGYNQMFDFRKASASSGDCYRLCFYTGSSESNFGMQLARRVGTGATLSPVANLAAGSIVRVRAVGSNIKVYINDIILWDIENTEITSGTFLGFSAASTNRLSVFNDLIVRNVV